MKIIRDTPQQLIVDATPWLWGIVMAVLVLIFVGAGLGMLASGEWFGLPFAAFGAAVGLAGFAAIVVRVQVILDRTDGSLAVRRRSISGYTMVRHDLGDLKGAVLEETAGSDDNTLYRPTLVLDRGMSAGRHPIVQAYTNTPGPARVVEAINTWLAAADHRQPAASVDFASDRG